MSNSCSLIDLQEISFDNNKTTGTVGKINGSRYTQVTTSTSSPCHRPTTKSTTHHRGGERNLRVDLEQHSPTRPRIVGVGAVREGQVHDDSCLPEDIDCFKCDSVKNLKQTGIDPGRIDKNSRLFFPVTFLILNIIYWTYYIKITEVSVEDLVAEDVDRLEG